jgi:hypothetical protein
MKIITVISAAILLIFLAISSVNAQESKGKKQQNHADQIKIETKKESQKTAPSMNLSNGLRFKSDDAKNVIFFLKPAGASFTIEF